MAFIISIHLNTIHFQTMGGCLCGHFYLFEIAVEHPSNHTPFAVLKDKGLLDNVVGETTTRLSRLGRL